MINATIKEISIGNSLIKRDLFKILLTAMSNGSVTVNIKSPTFPRSAPGNHDIITRTIRQN